MTEHLEFIHADHFQLEYQRKYATGAIAKYIDFCWETEFDRLFALYPKGFRDVLFPNIGYTYIINLGSPFTMQLQKSSFNVKHEGFIPRHHYIVSHHSPGNKLFGIKFKVCPILFEKTIDFSEYKELVYPLAYLINRDVVDEARKAATFDKRVDAIFRHYSEVIKKNTDPLNYVQVVAEILSGCSAKNDYNKPIEELSAPYKISTRTMQRYFNATTSFSSKQALQTMRIRAAVKAFTQSPSTFSYTDFGYYDYSHFLKHLQQFTGKYCPLFQQVYKRK